MVNHPGESPKKYWPIIHWDATCYLTDHDGYRSQLFHDKIAPNLARDLISAVRGSLGGVIRFLQAFVRSFVRRGQTPNAAHQQYVLLISVGTSKYAGEEQEIIEACGRGRLGTLLLRVDSRNGMFREMDQFSLDSMLHPSDYIGALWRWSCDVFRGRKWFFGCGGKSRSLFVSSIYSMRHYAVDVALSRRILSDYGTPLWSLSLCPSSSMSRAVFEHFKTRGILTAGVRTQATSYGVENLAINTDILFCKSAHEKGAYEAVFGSDGPDLEEGCVLSLPVSSDLGRLVLPEEYALLLGTAPSTGQDTGDYHRFNRKLFEAAAVARLPAIFKGHNLARDLDDAWFSGEGAIHGECVRISDIRHNRELIDRASLVLTAPSTLIYYAILRQIPVIVIEAEYCTWVADEYQSSPLKRVPWDQEIGFGCLDPNELTASARAAKEWFEKTYFLEKDSDFLVDFLLKEVGVGVSDSERRGSLDD